MAYQLWTSPVTGYRRKGTRAKEIRNLFENVTIRSVYEPLRACRLEEDAIEIAELLRKRHFDVVGVKEPERPITLFVRANTLNKGGTVRDHAENIAVEDLISDATPLAKMFSLLGSRHYFFVLVGGAVSGIVTRADLNKPPARIYLFGLISLLEMHLVFWIRKEFGDRWKEHVKRDRMAEAIKLFAERRKKGQELDLCECLQFCDKAALIMSSDDLCRLFSIAGTKSGEKIFRRIQSLRDLLAHGQTNLAEDYSWEELSRVVRWMEDALEKSDADVDKAALETGRDFIESFWSPANE